jgi:hypothetical protein
MRKFFSGFDAWMRVLDVDVDVDGEDLDCGMKACTTIGRRRRSKKIHDLMMDGCLLVACLSFCFENLKN